MIKHSQGTQVGKPIRLDSSEQDSSTGHEIQELKRFWENRQKSGMELRKEMLLMYKANNFKLDVSNASLKGCVHTFESFECPGTGIESPLNQKAQKYVHALVVRWESPKLQRHRLSIGPVQWTIRWDAV